MLVGGTTLGGLIGPVIGQERAYQAAQAALRSATGGTGIAPGPLAPGMQYSNPSMSGLMTPGAQVPAGGMEAAMRAALVSGLSIAGIDLLVSEEGVAVTEVNAAPGLKGLEEATGVDAAERIILAAESRVS